ncbi:MAG: GAF domain-containing protein [Solirubrobacteraceae bacterium]
MSRAARSVVDIARSVLSDLDLETVLQRVLESARELTGARYAALGVLGESRTELSRFITTGIDDATRAQIGALPRGRGVLGELIAHPAPLRLKKVGAHPHSYGFPHGHPPMDTFLGVPILVDGQPFGNLYLTEKDGGGEFTDADERSVLVLAELAGLAIDHASRYTGASRRRDELERTVATLDATTQITHAVGAETDLNVVLELIVKRGRALVDARALAIELVQGTELVVAAGAGEMTREVLGGRLKLADTVASAALRTRTTQRLDDELNRARYEERGLGMLGLHASAGLVVPLLFQNRPYGVIVAIDRLRDGPSFSAEDVTLLEAFAASAATAVATAQSVASEHRRQRLAAAEAERQRWARELHDETLQSLSALRVGLSTAKRSERSDALDLAVSGAIEHLEDSITNLRALITDLRPASLDELGTGAAVQALCERTSRYGLEVDANIDLAYEAGREPTRHTPELETAIYRIVQEALTNATKHGKAKQVAVELREREGVVHISVRDDGEGFDPDAHTGGFGLLGMRERVQLLEGTLRIESARGSGTTIAASFPAQRHALVGVDPPTSDADVPHPGGGVPSHAGPATIGINPV